MGKQEFDIYASTKTTAQLFLDLAAAVSHCFTLYVLLQMNLGQRDTKWDILFYLVSVTIGIQGILAVGLFTLRLMVLNHHNGQGQIPKAARYLNNIFFWTCLIVALLEVTIAGMEKLALDGKHSIKDCPAIHVNSEDTLLTGQEGSSRI